LTRFIKGEAGSRLENVTLVVRMSKIAQWRLQPRKRRRLVTIERTEG
jgi:hypothetical protein